MFALTSVALTLILSLSMPSSKAASFIGLLGRKSSRIDSVAAKEGWRLDSTFKFAEWELRFYGDADPLSVGVHGELQVFLTSDTVELLSLQIPADSITKARALKAAKALRRSFERALGEPPRNSFHGWHLEYNWYSPIPFASIEWMHIAEGQSPRLNVGVASNPMYGIRFGLVHLLKEKIGGPEDTTAVRLYKQFNSLRFPSKSPGKR